MNAQPVAALSKEITPSPPRLPDLGQRASFVSLLVPTPTPTPSAAPTGNSASQSVPATAPPKANTNAGSNQDGRDANSDHHHKSHGGTTAVVIPLPVPMVLSFQQPQQAVTSGAAPASPAGASALSLQDLLQQPVAGGPPPAVLAGSADPSAANAAGAANAAAAAQSATPATTQALPSIAAALNARIATGATAMVSQPRVALASLAPDTAQTASAKTTGTESETASPAHLPDAPALDLAHASAKPATPVTPENATGILATAVKNTATSIPLPEHTAATQSQGDTTTTVGDGASDTSANAAQVAAMTAPPANPAPAAAAAAGIAVVPHGVAEQVAVNLRQAVRAGADHIEIQLQPADLGAINVKLNVNHDGRVTMVVSADRSDTLNMLQQDASSLAQALRDAGLQADNSSLSFNLRGGYQFNQQGAASGGSRAVAPATAGAIDDVAAITAAAPRSRVHSGSLDIQV